jgi:glyoxylase I family protein
MIEDIHHLGLTVRDVEASAAWYTDVLGFHRVGEFAAPDGARRKVFLRHDGLRARLGLTQHRGGPWEAFDETRAGLDHLAFATSSREALDNWARRLADAGVVFSPVASSNSILGAAVLVFRDPDNIQLELFFDPTDTRYDIRYDVRPVGWVESPLVDPAAAPAQGDEGAPEAWVALRTEVLPAMRDLAVGSTVIVMTWLDRADRDVLAVHPRGDSNRPEQGVFSTRSPDRPNPIGLHEVQIVAIDGTRIRVRDLEAFDGTPIVDIKPVLGPIHER